VIRIDGNGVGFEVSEGSLMAEIRPIIARMKANHETLPIEWIVNEVMKAHPLPEFPGCVFYRVNAYLNVYKAVQKAVRESNGTADEADGTQPELPGFPGVQEYYSVMRDGKSIAVPAMQLRVSEAQAKLLEFRNNEAGNKRKGDALERFIEQVLMPREQPGAAV
jgi:hypothetical protein